MFMFRRGAVAVASGALLVQLAVVIAIAVVPAFCCVPATAAATGLPDCCKGDKHSCPLKKSAAPADSDSGDDSLSSCTQNDNRITSLLFGAPGVLVSVMPLEQPAVVAELAHDSASEVVSVAAAETPPPRG